MPSIINAATSGGLISTADTSGVLQLQTASTTALTINASQNVGVGITNPNSFGKLAVKTSSTSVVAGLAVIASANDSFLTIYDGNSTLNIGATYSSTGSYRPIAFLTSDVERMRINAGAPILCLAGGNTSATGTGIAFPATQSASTDANTLDDYEEGTFTPTIAGSSTIGTASYARQIGIYTKIGNRVFFTIGLSWSSGNGAGILRILGLPFTQDGGGFDIPYSISESGNVTWDANYFGTPIGLNNTTTININQSRVGGSGGALNTAYDNAGDLIMSGHYRVA